MIDSHHTHSYTKTNYIHTLGYQLVNATGAGVTGTHGKAVTSRVCTWNCLDTKAGLSPIPGSLEPKTISACKYLTNGA